MTTYPSGPGPAPADPGDSARPARPVHPVVGWTLTGAAAAGVLMAIAGCVIHGATVLTSLAGIWVPVIVVAAFPVALAGVWYWVAGSRVSLVAFALLAVVAAVVGMGTGCFFIADAVWQSTR